MPRAGMGAQAGEIGVQEERLSAGCLQKLEGRILFFSRGSVKFVFSTAEESRSQAPGSALPWIMGSPRPAPPPRAEARRGDSGTRSNKTGPAGVYRVGERMIEVPTIDLQTPDELLVRRARGGEPSAFADLFHRHRDGAYRLAYRQLGNEQDALDVVQESMIKAFSALGEFDGRSGFRTWLMRIVTNTALDWGRRRKRRPGPDFGRIARGGEGGEPLHEDDPERGLHQQDLRDALDRALENLSPTIRATFVLHAESGLSYKEIAEAQGIPIGTVMSRIHAAREKLQAELDWDRLMK